MTEIPMWAVMWGLAGGLFAACKVLMWARYRGPVADGRGFAYLFYWPGMDAKAFLDPALRPAPPAAAEWLFGIAKAGFGAALVWLVAPGAADPIVKGWIGLVGMVFVLHFGTFHLASLFWRQVGVQAEPIMKAPLLSESLGDLWGRRWNLGFHDLAREFVYQPLAPRVGGAWAALAVFFVSGLIHDLVISIPAGAGYGLPTAYFMLQGAGVLFERTAAGRKLGFGRGFIGRFLAFVIAAGPAYWLFHPPFIRKVFLPFMEVIGA